MGPNISLFVFLPSLVVVIINVQLLSVEQLTFSSLCSLCWFSPDKAKDAKLLHMSSNEQDIQIVIQKKKTKLHFIVIFFRLDLEIDCILIQSQYLMTLFGIVLFSSTELTLILRDSKLNYLLFNFGLGNRDQHFSIFSNVLYTKRLPINLENIQFNSVLFKQSQITIKLISRRAGQYRILQFNLRETQHPPMSKHMVTAARKNSPLMSRSLQVGGHLP